MSNTIGKLVSQEDIDFIKSNARYSKSSLRSLLKEKIMENGAISIKALVENLSRDDEIYFGYLVTGKVQDFPKKKNVTEGVVRTLTSKDFTGFKILLPYGVIVPKKLKKKI